MARLPPTIDDIFRALADPTRRTILERLKKGPAVTSVLAAQSDMALPSFLQHLQVLRRCGLVSTAKFGRTRLYRLAPKPLKLARSWLVRMNATRPVQ